MGQCDGSKSGCESTKLTKLPFLVRKCRTPKTRQKAQGSQTEQHRVKRDLRGGDTLLNTTIKAEVNNCVQSGILPSDNTAFSF